MGLYSYRQRVRVITLLINIFLCCFCMLSDFAKVFERKVWRVQVAHLHNAACALSSPSRSFQLSTNLGKDFFRYLWYCDKKTNRMWFSVALVKFHWFGINWQVFNQSECRNCCLLIIIKKIAPQAKSGIYFPRFERKIKGSLEQPHGMNCLHRWVSNLRSGIFLQSLYLWW